MESAMIGLRMPRLTKRVALVTGAGQGVGRGIALAMAREGADVAVVELRPETAASTAEELLALGVRAVAIPCDVATREACRAAVETAVAELGGVDILVNNAGWAQPSVPLLEVGDEQFQRTLAINTLATFWFMQLCHPHLLARGGGSIINFGSGSGTQGLPGEGPYAAAKEAVRGLSRVAANEWGPDGIRVNVICPFANSPGMEMWSRVDPKTYEATLRRIPLRRVGDCETDIGRAAVFLASDDAAYVTGQTLMVDGGAGAFRPAGPPRDVRGELRMGRLTDRVAIVTGAGQGIGRGVARALAAEGGRAAKRSRPPSRRTSRPAVPRPATSRPTSRTRPACRRCSRPPPATSGGWTSWSTMPPPPAACRAWSA
jgi:NAD(P)-dependent dehydrogenase (short-subunit alcohol dehydrogenase family)